MQSPRIGLVFWLWQCDKENHGWREGPPLTVVLAREFRSVEGLHPPEIFNSNEKKNTAICRYPQTYVFWRLAGILPFHDHNRSEPANFPFANQPDKMRSHVGSARFNGMVRLSPSQHQDLSAG